MVNPSTSSTAALCATPFYLLRKRLLFFKRCSERVAEVLWHARQLYNHSLCHSSQCMQSMPVHLPGITFPALRIE